MRKRLCSGATVALLTLGGLTLPTAADSPSTLADPIGIESLGNPADPGTAPGDVTRDEVLDRQAAEWRGECPSPAVILAPQQARTRDSE